MHLVTLKDSYWIFFFVSFKHWYFVSLIVIYLNKKKSTALPPHTHTRSASWDGEARFSECTWNPHKLPIRPDNNEKLFLWGDGDVGCLGWDQVKRGETSYEYVERAGVITWKNPSFLLDEKENMANSSSPLAAAPMTTAQGHRAEVLENPFQVSAWLSHWISC